MKKVFLISLLVLTSCTKQDPMPSDNAVSLQIEDVKIKDAPSYDFSGLKLMNLSDFHRKYDFGYANRLEMDQLISEIAEKLFQEQDDSEEKLTGFEIRVSKHQTVVYPLVEGQGSTSANSLRDSKGCPDGFDSLEVCYSRDCVTETISDFMVENASQIENGATVSIKLEDAALGGKRVCGKVSLDSEQ